MPTSFDINTYDLLQRSISTTEALNQLGTDQRDAAFEAVETVLDDREDSISEEAYITEAVVATGPAVDTGIISDQFERSFTEGTMSNAVTALLEAVFTAATYTDAFDPVMMNELERPPAPQDSYDASPEDLLAMFRKTATEWIETTEESATEDPFAEAAAHVLESHPELESLPYTALAIVLDHIYTEHEIDPVVEPPSITQSLTLTEFALTCLEACLAVYFRETLSLEANV